MERTLKTKIVVNNPKIDWDASKCNGLQQYIRHKTNFPDKTHYNRNVIVTPSNGKTRIPVIKKKTKKKKNTKLKQNSSDTKKIPVKDDKNTNKQLKDTANVDNNSKQLKCRNIWNNTSFHVQHCKTSDQLPQPILLDDDLGIMDNETRPNAYSSKTTTFLNPISILKGGTRSADNSEQMSSNNTWDSNRTRNKGVSYEELNPINQKQKPKKFHPFNKRSKIATKNLIISDPLKISIPLYPTRARREDTPDTENVFGSTPGINTESQESSEGAKPSRSHHRILAPPKPPSETNRRRKSVHNSKSNLRETVRSYHKLLSSKTNIRNSASNRSRTAPIRSQLSRSKLNKKHSKSEISRHAEASPRRRSNQRRSPESTFGSDTAVNVKTREPKTSNFGKGAPLKTRDNLYAISQTSISKSEAEILDERINYTEKEIERKSSSIISLLNVVPIKYSINSKGRQNINQRNEPKSQMKETIDNKRSGKTSIPKYRPSIHKPSRRSKTSFDSKTFVAKSHSKSHHQLTEPPKSRRDPLRGPESTFGFDVNQKKCGCSRNKKEFSEPNQISNRGPCECSVSIKSKKMSEPTPKGPCECSNVKSERTSIPRSKKEPCECSVYSKSNRENTFGSDTALDSKKQINDREAQYISREQTSSPRKTSQINKRDPCECSTSTIPSKLPTRRSIVEKSNGKPCKCSTNNKGEKTLIPTTRGRYSDDIPKPYDNVESTFGSNTAVKDSGREPLECSVSVKSSKSSIGNTFQAERKRRQSYLNKESLTTSENNNYSPTKDAVRYRSKLESIFGSAEMKSRNSFPYDSKTSKQTTQEPSMSIKSNIESTFGSDTAIKHKVEKSNDKACECSPRPTPKKEPCECSPSIKSKNTTSSDASRKRFGYGALQKSPVRSISNIESTFGSDADLKYTSQQNSASMRRSTSTKSNRGSCECLTGVPKAITRRSTNDPCECSPSTKSKNSVLSDASRKRFGYGATQKSQKACECSALTNGFTRDPCECSAKSRTTLLSNASSNRKRFGYVPPVRSRSNLESKFGSDVALQEDPCECSTPTETSVSLSSKKSRSNIESTFGSDIKLAHKNPKTISSTSNRKSFLQKITACCANNNPSREALQERRPRVNSHKSKSKPLRSGSNLQSTFGSDLALKDPSINSKKTLESLACECSTPNISNEDPCECSQASKSNIESLFGSDAALNKACECSIKTTTSPPRAPSIRDPCECSTGSRSVKSPTRSQKSNQDPCECSTGSKSVKSPTRSQKSDQNPCLCSAGSKDTSRKSYKQLKEESLKRSRSNIESTFGSDAALKDQCTCSASYKSRKSEAGSSRGPCECSTGSRSVKSPTRSQKSNQNPCECSTGSKSVKSPTRSQKSDQNPCVCSAGSKDTSRKSYKQLKEESLKRSRSNIESTFGSDAALKDQCTCSASYKSRKSEAGSSRGPCECSTGSRSVKSPTRSQKSNQDPCECSTGSKSVKSPTRSQKSNQNPCLCSAGSKDASKKSYKQLLKEESLKRSRSNIESTFGSDAALKDPCECSVSHKSRKSEAVSSRGPCECSTGSRSVKSPTRSQKSNQNPCQCSAGSKDASKKSYKQLLKEESLKRSRSNIESTFGSDAALKNPCECSIGTKIGKGSTRKSQDLCECCKCKKLREKTLKGESSRSNVESTFGSDAALKDPCECSVSHKSRKSEAVSSRGPCECSTGSRSVKSPTRSKKSNQGPCECSTSLKNKKSLKEESKSNIESTFGSDAALLPCSCLGSNKSRKSEVSALGSRGPCECSIGSKSVKSPTRRSTSQKSNQDPCECNVSNATITTPKNKGTTQQPRKKSLKKEPSQLSNIESSFGSEVCVCNKKKTSSAGKSTDGSKTSWHKNRILSKISSLCKNKAPNGTIDKENVFGSNTTLQKSRNKSEGTVLSRPSPPTSKSPISGVKVIKSPINENASQTSILKAHSKYDKKKSILPSLHRSTSRLRITKEEPTAYSKSDSNEIKSKIPRPASGASPKSSKVGSETPKLPCACSTSNKSKNIESTSKSSKGKRGSLPDRAPSSTKSRKSLTPTRSISENTFGSDAALTTKKETPKNKSNTSINSENTFGSDAHIKAHHRRSVSGGRSSARSSRTSVHTRKRARKPRSKTSITSHKTKIKVVPKKSSSRRSSRHSHGKRPHPSKSDLGAVLAGQAPRSGSTLIVSKNLQGSCTSKGVGYPAAHTRSLTYVTDNPKCTPDYVCPGVAKGPKAAQLINTPSGPILYEKCYPGTCGKLCSATPCEVSYAHAVVSKFKNYTIYELTKQFRRRPWNMSKVTEGVFVVKSAR